MKKIGFFVPCYIEQLAPQAAASSLNLLRRFEGLQVEKVSHRGYCALPVAHEHRPQQSCRYDDSAIRTLDRFDAVVIPSGICSNQLRDHFMRLGMTDASLDTVPPIYDIVDFLHDVLKVNSLPWAKFPYRVALHDDCPSLGDIMQSVFDDDEPPVSKTADLLSLVEGLEISKAPQRNECCGLGGMFTVWDQSCFDSNAHRSINDYAVHDLKYFTSGDMSCLLAQQMAARREGLGMKYFYVAELLNGDARP